MQVELQSRGVEVEPEYPEPQVQFKGVIVGDYAADLFCLWLINIIVELLTDLVL